MTYEKDKERERGKNVGLAVQAINNLCKRRKRRKRRKQRKHGSTNSLIDAVAALPKKRRAVVSKIIIDFAATIKTDT